MREIKFRAWINGGESAGFAHVMTYDLAFSEYAPVNEQLNAVFRSGALMQYTGLKDCNGVEVYEGDIVCSDSYPFTSDGMVNYRGVVVFENGTYYYDMYVVSNRVRGAACGDILAERIGSLSVVGNIHENPELLESD